MMITYDIYRKILRRAAAEASRIESRTFYDRNGNPVPPPTSGYDPRTTAIVPYHRPPGNTEQTTCPDCKGTGKIVLFSSTVDCDCQKRSNSL